MYNNYTVYMHIAPSGKKYIGITRQNPLTRWGHNGVHYKTQIFYKAIEKYGWDNIKHEILFTNLSKDDACKKEQELIEKYKTKDSRYGYNLNDGGKGNIGYIWTKEQKERMSIAFKGKKLPKEWRNNISNGLKTRTKEVRQRAAQKISGENCPFSKPIDVYDTDFNYLFTCHTARIASEKTGADFKNISDCCRGKQKTANGYRFCYSGEDIDREPRKTTAKKVGQYDLEDNFIQSFSSTQEAGKYLHENFGLKLKPAKNNVSACCLGKKKTCGGFIWKYT